VRDRRGGDFNRRPSWQSAGTATTAAPDSHRAATRPRSAKPIGRVIVIGGGYGRRPVQSTSMWSERRIEVFLIEREAQFVSCPLSNLVLGGSRQIGDLTIGYEKLREYGVQVIRDEVTEIVVDRKRVRLKKIEDLPYDRLVISPGIDFMYDQIPGLNNPEAQKTIPHAWKAVPNRRPRNA
jgi:sulfite dehydrogenase